MTDQHPLTDEVIEEIAHSGYIDDYGRYNYAADDMRAAADWQLEQVIQAWNQCMAEPVTDLQFIRLFSKKLKAMRPTTTQEDN